MRHAYPIISSDAIHTIVNGPIERSPIRHMTANHLTLLLSTVASVNVLPARRSGHTTTCGVLRPRDHPTLSRPLTICNDGSGVTPEATSLEQALFPYLFPHGTGAWDGGMQLTHYLRMRMTALFSPFTLCKSYLLLMYHLRQSHMLAGAASEQVLQRDMDNYMRYNPSANTQQILSNVLKHSIPASVPGSPAYFKQQLQDLLARVAKWGLPHFFLTLTADEASGMRWTEITDLETLLNAFNNSFNFRDAPVEAATHFLRRCKDFLAEHVFRSDGSGILGCVGHYVIRYAVQDCGSLHAHIVIWLEPSNVNNVASEISACIPAAFDEATQEFTPPTNPEQLALFQLVSRKQIHVCRPGMCLGDTHQCRYGFPHAVQPNHAPLFEARPTGTVSSPTPC